MTDGNECCDGHRRRFLGGAMLAGVAAASLGGEAQAAALGQAARDAMTPDGVIKEMLDGNLRFRSRKPRPRNFIDEMRGSATGQFPAAVVLSCVDSRAPVEILCDLGLGDTFNARVAGNASNDDILGSMEFACAAAGAKLVLVMGHTRCGAIKGAIDNVVLGNLTLLLARFKGAIDATAYTGDRSGKNYDFVDAVAKTNVTQVVATIRERSDVLRGLERDGKIKIAGSMYDIATGTVSMI